jgi:hypothetical protein
MVFSSTIHLELFDFVMKEEMLVSGQKEEK